MPPSLALLLWLILLLGLLCFDPARSAEPSAALWVPLTWMFIVGSRLVSQWLGSQVGVAAQTFEDGNPLDRTVYSLLIVLAVGILISRSFKWGTFFVRNFALTAFLFFALVSIVWSDFPLVAFKRWFRDLGHCLVILVVLTDSHPVEAVRTLLRRLCYLLIPLSIVLIKYFPGFGTGYDRWTGAATYMGATTSKNMLGVACLISGIFFFWDTVTRWSDRKERRTRRIIMVNFAFIAMTLWLLHLADSATSRVCLVIGCLIIAAAHSDMFRRRSGLLKVLIPACFVLYLILAFGFNVNGDLASAIGRDPTLTDRTLIWKNLLSMNTNPLVGTGYESFWLGSRLALAGRSFEAGLNEAHNGYLDIYLGLGVIGICLLAGFLIASYRNICRQLTSSPSVASLNLALWTITLFYNMTESAFKFHLMWVVFLLAAIAVPAPAADRVRGVASFDNAGATERFLRPPLETVSHRR